MAAFVWGPDDEAHERIAIESEGCVDDDRPSGVYPIVGFDDASTGTDDVPF